MSRKKYERKDWSNTTREEIEKEHYPITWAIEDNEIKIWNRFGKQLSKRNLVYTTEITFIQNEISTMRFSGEICIV